MSQFEPMTPGREPEKIAVVGSGSWATALARIAAASALEKEGFDEEVRFWVREREVSFLQGPAFYPLGRSKFKLTILPLARLSVAPLYVDVLTSMLNISTGGQGQAH